MSVATAVAEQTEAAPGSAWLVDALCGSHPDPDLWFDPDREAEAKAVCSWCPVRSDCLTAALVDPDLDEFGVFGGLTPDERREVIRVALRSAAA